MFLLWKIFLLFYSSVRLQLNSKLWINSTAVPNIEKSQLGSRSNSPLSKQNPVRPVKGTAGCTERSVQNLATGIVIAGLLPGCQTELSYINSERLNLASRQQTFYVYITLLCFVCEGDSILKRDHVCA